MTTSVREGKMIINNELLTLEETARLLRVSETWLRRSSCPRVRFGAKTVRYSVADVTSWIDARRSTVAGAA
jgi:predicted DNA-binding transcriptional regulator AlpA